MTTRVMLTIAMCVTVVLAGCAGFGGGGDNGTTASGADTTEATAVAEADTTAAGGEETTAAGDTATATEGEEATTAATDATTTAGTMMGEDTTMAATTAMPTAGESPATTVGSVAGSDAFRFLAFEQPGTYTYEITFAPTVSSQRGTAEPVTRQGDNQSGEYVIDVVQASENQYEVQVSLSMDGMDNQQTFTGTRMEVQRQLLSSRVGMFFAPLTTMTGFYGGRTLQSGQSWSYSTEQGTASFEVTGEDSYAGVDCSVTEASLNGTVVHEACVSPDRGLAPYAAYYDENGSLTFEMELTSYEAG